jgi:hypothetical protein
MKRYDYIMKHGIVISILIVLLSFALVGTVAAAGPQAPGLSGFGNGTPHMAHYQNMTANSSIWGHGNMMQNYGSGMGMRGAYPGIQGGAGAVHGTGIVHAAFMFFGIILAVLLSLVWLIVGILMIVLLVRKLRKPKTP